MGVRLAIAGLVASVVAATPSDARACSWDNGAQTIVPAGAEHPANAAVVLVGAMLLPDDLVATIDGVPVSLVVDEQLAVHHSLNLSERYFILPLHLSPAPRPGQNVAISGNPCSPNCNAVEIAYVAGEPDLEIADAEPSLTFDLARFSGGTSNTCNSWGSLVHTTVAIDEAAFADEAFVLYEVTARHDDSGLLGTERNVLGWSEFGPDVLFPTDVVGEAFPLEGWCVDVRMIDAAGNHGTTVTSCDACMFYDGEAISHTDDIPYVPIADGPCDPGGTSSASTDEGAATTDDPTTGTTATTSGDEVASDMGDGTDETAPAEDDDTTTDRGCACTSGGAPPFIAWLMIAGARRRRRLGSADPVRRREAAAVVA